MSLSRPLVTRSHTSVSHYSRRHHWNHTDDLGHDSALSVVYPSGPGEPPAAHVSVRCPSLPYLALTFASESTIVAAGHDCQPVVFTGSSSGWSFSHSLDDPSNAASKGLTPSSTGSRAPSAGPGRLNNEAFNLFKQADTRGVSRSSIGGNTPSSAGMAAVGQDGLLLTVHQNSITWIDAYEWGSNGDVAKVSTAGRDGKLVIWNVTKK